MHQNIGNFKFVTLNLFGYALAYRANDFLEEPIFINLIKGVRHTIEMHLKP